MWDERENSQVAFVTFEREVGLCRFFFSLWDVKAQGGRRGGGAGRGRPSPPLFFFSRHPPKLLILQSASARAGADRTFSDQQLGRVTGEEDSRDIGLEGHRMLATVVLVFFFVCTFASG